MNAKPLAFAAAIAKHLGFAGLLEDCSRVKGIHFDYNLEVHNPGEAERVIEAGNLLTDQGLRYFGGGTSIDGDTQYPSLYQFLYTNPRTPLVTDTAANIPEYGELVSGVDLTSRPEWLPVRSGFVYDSSSNKSVWTVTATEITVYGIGIVTVGAFGATTGLLLSARLLDSPETVKSEGTFKSSASIEFTRG